MSLPLAHVGSGTYEPLQILPPALIAFAYARRSLTLSQRGDPLPAWRQWSFFAGVAVVLVTLASPLAHVGEELVTGHMAQHLLLVDVAALLIVLGVTGPVLQPLLAIRGLGWLRHLFNPVPAFALWAGNLYLWHIPAVYEAAAFDSEPLHAIQHLCFLGTGVAMWMALLGPLPKPSWFGAGAKLGYVAAVRLAGAGLGNIFMWSGTVLYPGYASGEDYWGLAPLADQSTAGVVMMLESTLLTLATFAWLFFEAAREGEEKQRLLDLAHERGVALSEARARRAVSAGHGDLLERRIRAGKPSGDPEAFERRSGRRRRQDEP